MKKTLIAYSIILTALGFSLFFLSMSWMNFLFKPNLNREIAILLNEADRLQPLTEDGQYQAFSQDLNNSLKSLGIFSSHFDYYQKIAPAFTHFKDTFTYLDFWEGSLHSASVLPMIFDFRGGECISRYSLANLIPEGASIKKINGKEITEIISFYSDFVYAATEEERSFWIAERELFNYYPHFFPANEYEISYVHNDELQSQTIQKIPWREYDSWKRRVESEWYQVTKDKDLSVLKINNFTPSDEISHELRMLMEDIVDLNPNRLLIDVSDAQGEGGNFYNLQLLLSFLSKEEGFLIESQTTVHVRQEKVLSVIPQSKIYEGEVYLLISKYSVYPHIRALISFCTRNDIANIIGEEPLCELSFYSNPTTQPLYNSYLIPKICRTYNELGIKDFANSVRQKRQFNAQDYINLLKFEADYESFTQSHSP